MKIWDPSKSSLVDFTIIEIKEYALKSFKLLRDQIRELSHLVLRVYLYIQYQYRNLIYFLISYLIQFKFDICFYNSRFILLSFLNFLVSITLSESSFEIFMNVYL